MDLISAEQVGEILIAFGSVGMLVLTAIGYKVKSFIKEQVDLNEKDKKKILKVESESTEIHSGNTHNIEMIIHVLDKMLVMIIDLRDVHKDPDSPFATRKLMEKTELLQNQLIAMQKDGADVKGIVIQLSKDLDETEREILSHILHNKDKLDHHTSDLYKKLEEHGKIISSLPAIAKKLDVL